ncbi:MAG: hypothetical protein FVQ80_11210 [Planctomycetes bacterium]|nr:hypothetical protein [Planctomycetota bacterium]
MPKEKLTNEYIAKVVSSFVHHAGPSMFLMREVTEDEDRFFRSEYADHDPAEGNMIWALKHANGHTIIFGHKGRQMIRNPENFNQAEYYEHLQDES